MEYYKGISYLEVGNPEGTPLVYFHGCPGSFLEVESLAQNQTYRIIAINRPGISYSNFYKLDSIYAFTEYVADLVDHLKIDKFGVVGYSGGGPYALACARAFPERLLFVKDLSGAAPVYLGELAKLLNPMDKLSAFIAKRLPFLLPSMFWMIGYIVRKTSNKTIIKSFRKSLCQSDYEWMQGNVGTFRKVLAEAFRGGVKGPSQDGKLAYLSWGFSLDEIDFPVELHHGTADQFVPFAFAQYKKKHLKHSDLIEYPEKGHLEMLHLLAKIL